jgi:hypothetical protein
MVRGSYVSLQSALAYYGLIPEYVPVVTSVTVGRPAHWDTPLGFYTFRHVKVELFRGYRLEKVSPAQNAFVASPEKALLDLIHLEPGADSLPYIRELRLQNLERLDLDEMAYQANRSRSPKLLRAAALVSEWVQSEALEYETL